MTLHTLNARYSFQCLVTGLDQLTIADTGENDPDAEEQISVVAEVSSRDSRLWHYISMRKQAHMCAHLDAK